MSAPTIETAAPLSEAARRTGCRPWCIHHPEQPGLAPHWADPIDLRLYPAVGRDEDEDGESGHLTVLLSHDPAPRYGRRSRTAAIRFDRHPDGEDGGDMDPDEAEIAAHALLSMAALARGDNDAAALHRATGENAAAALLGRRQDG